MSRNFNIQSIIDGGDSAANPKLAEAMSQFRTPVFDTGDAKALTPALPAPLAATGAASGAASSATTAKALAPLASLQEHMKKFQTHLDFGDAKLSLTSPTPVVLASTAKPPARSLINLLINNEEPPADAALALAPAKAPVKRQRKAPVKKRTATAAADGAKATPGEKPAKKTKTKKATPEVNPAVAAPDPKVITLGSTTEKNKNTTETKTPALSILNLLNDEPQEEEVAKPTPPPAPAKDKEPVRDLIDDLYNRESRDKPKPLPIIALNIPLLDPNNPKPGQAEVVVNVLKLSEEKYGFDAIHPNAKLSTELMNDMLEEDDDDNADDDDIEIIVMPQLKQQQLLLLAAKKGAEEEELTEEQLAHRHQVRMNKRVGKYDYEDPFIDDEELQIVEDISTTKEGFFVYWGPLVEETKPVKKTKKRTTEK